MRLLTELKQLGFLTSAGLVSSCVLKATKERWTQGVSVGRLEMCRSLHYKCTKAWIGLQYWSSSHRLKFFFSNMGDGSRKVL
ncbi:hypothetical protein HNY73_016398 [Argiope bruennichi]|uniref:Uncharacterized protein n=1 Tax=Argiope bruennichi TaxID=94029 RepID=A0A8T0EIM2_ARGBR|nr:hypothetical protein HNY73_016398 [Argiope bruennichi]